MRFEEIEVDNRDFNIGINDNLKNSPEYSPGRQERF
jgi:hypothetical protein